MTAAAAFGEQWPMTWQQRQERLLPDNPVSIDQHGTVHGLLAASPAHQQQFHDYLASLHPLKPGRPKDRETQEEFLAEVCPIIQKIREMGIYPSQERVAELLYPRDAHGARKLRRRAGKHRLSWDDILVSAN
jgi:hypothetical protein